MNLNTENAMIIFTDGSALSNPGPVGAGVVIKNKGPKSTLVKLAKAVKQMGTSYQGEIEAIKLAVEYANENQAAILSITSQDSKKYHNSMIRQIRENILDILKYFEYLEKVDNIKIIYCPAHIGIEGNELADGLAKTGAKKAKYLQPDPKITLPQLKQSNKVLSIKKWSRRWNNSFQHKYKNIVPNITQQNLAKRSILLKNTSRKGITKIIRLKTEHSLLEGHKSKIDQETQPECTFCKVKETSEHFLLNCAEFGKERAKLEKLVMELYNNKKIRKSHIDLDDLLVEGDLPIQESIIIKIAAEKLLLSTQKEI